MKQASRFLLSLSLIFSTTGVVAQVYETTDEQGNLEFSDVPVSEESRPVELDSTNIADSVEVRPPAPEAPAQEKPATPAAAPADSTVIIGDNDDLRDDLYEERRRREIRERLPGREQPPTATPLPAPAPRPHGGRR